MSGSFFQTTIGDQVTLQRGFDITKSQQITGNVPVVSSGGVSSYHNEAMVKGPGVVLGRKGTLGTVFFINEDYWPHDTSLWVKDFKNNNPRFVYYFFKNISEELKKMDVGAANPTLNRNHVHPIPVKWTDRENQDKIVKILSSLDDKIALNRQISQTLEAMLQALFKSWFINFEPVRAKVDALETGQDATRAAMRSISGKTDAELDNFRNVDPDAYAQLHVTASLFPDELVDSELSLVPKGWVVRAIDDTIVRLSVGKKYAQKTAFPQGLVPILDQGKSGFIGFHNDEPGIKASTDNPVIVFTNHTCFTRLITFDFSVIQNVLPFRGKGINVHWLFQATSGKQPFIEYKGHWPDFVRKEIIIPNNKLDQVFGRVSSKLFESAYSNESQIKYLCDLRDTLLPKLLSGEVILSTETE